MVNYASWCIMIAAEMFPVSLSRLDFRSGTKKQTLRTPLMDDLTNDSPTEWLCVQDKLSHERLDNDDCWIIGMIATLRNKLIVEPTFIECLFPFCNDSCWRDPNKDEWWYMMASDAQRMVNGVHAAAHGRIIGRHIALRPPTRAWRMMKDDKLLLTAHGHGELVPGCVEFESAIYSMVNTCQQYQQLWWCLASRLVSQTESWWLYNSSVNDD